MVPVLNKGNLLKKIFKTLFQRESFKKPGVLEKPNLDDCIGCGLCISACPTNAIKVFKYREVICLHCGACIDACPNDAISLDRFTIDKSKCIGCGYCALVCTIPIIKNEIPLPSTPIITNKCNNCGLCIIKCPEGSIYFKDNKISINKEKCKNCLYCVEFCPMNSIMSPKDYIKSLIINVDIYSCIYCKECEYVCPLRTTKK